MNTQKFKVAGRQWLVGRIYADHNESSSVRRALARCLGSLCPTDRSLNVGAGSNRLTRNIVNTDIGPNAGIDVRCRGEALPFSNNAFALVLSQEVLEHVADPDAVLAEMYRVLKPGGVLYCQVPFIIGWHPCPCDYWRFSREGLEKIVSAHGLACEEVGIAVGPATALYRIAVEFVAITVAAVSTRLYIPAKGCAAAFLYPLKGLDWLYRNNRRAERLAAGYYIIARKPGGGA